jgi:hypothetical protein
MDFDIGGTTYDLDSGCYRNWSSMANHGNSNRVNVEFREVDLRYSHVTSNGMEPGRVDVRHPVHAIRSAPALLHRFKGRRGDMGLAPRSLWLVANRRINAGTELLVDYGDHADAVVQGVVRILRTNPL